MASRLLNPTVKVLVLQSVVRAVVPSYRVKASVLLVSAVKVLVLQ
jgi:hypothetical protein